MCIQGCRGPPERRCAYGRAQPALGIPKTWLTALSPIPAFPPSPKSQLPAPPRKLPGPQPAAPSVPAARSLRALQNRGGSRDRDRPPGGVGGHWEALGAADWESKQAAEAPARVV